MHDLRIKRRSISMAAYAAAHLRSLLLDNTEVERRCSLCNYFKTFKARLFSYRQAAWAFFLSGISSRKGSVLRQDVFRIPLGSIELGFTNWVAICESFVCVPVFICFLFSLLMRYRKDPKILKFSYQDQVRQEQGKVKLRGKIAAEQVRWFSISCSFADPDPDL